MTQVRDVVRAMEEIAPPWMAKTGDSIGLQAGHSRGRVRRVMVALDPCRAAVDAARAARCDMLVVHHPLMKTPLASLDESLPEAAAAAVIVRSGLAVYVAHTNLDVAPGGINDILAAAAGLREARHLVETAGDQRLKLAIFVPVSHADKVRRAVCEAGAGRIGEYSECSFSVAGTGTFRGSMATHPAVGRAGDFEQAQELCVEVVLTRSIKKPVLDALTKVHPYEEPAYDLCVLDEAKPYGLGRVGEVEKPVAVKALADRMARFCRSRCTQILGDAGKRVKRILVWSGGGCPVATAVANGVELVICGELRHYDLLTLQDAGITAVLLGHGPSEAVIVKPLAAMLGKALPGVRVRTFVDESPLLRNV